jgi:hypothetical protein
MLWLGRLEALLARHWPEATRLLDLNSVTLLRALAHYGGPAKLAEDPAAVKQLAMWGRRGLERTKIEQVIASAARTVGTRQGPRDVQQMQQFATLALAAHREAQQAWRQLAVLAKTQRACSGRPRSPARRLPACCGSPWAIRATILRAPIARRWA